MAEIDVTRLRDILSQQAPRQGTYITPIEGVRIYRRDNINTPENCFSVPRIVKVAQGRKRTLVGTDEFVYGEGEVFIAGLDMPNTSNVIEATSERPFLSMTVDLDKNLIAQLAMEMPNPISGKEESATGLVIQPDNAEMLDAFMRLAVLLDKPEQIPIIAPMIVREIHYRILIGPEGDNLRLFYTYGSHKNQIARAVSWLRQNFKERLAVEELAETVHMAISTFHHQFKKTTSISPLQFQKRIRLHEAQRLMLMENLDANSACAAVGYESLTQFNREYKRYFGEPPRRNVTRWQQEHSSVGAFIPWE